MTTARVRALSTSTRSRRKEKKMERKTGMVKVLGVLNLYIDGSSTHGMDGMLGYPSLPRQQLLALDPNIYGGEPFRHGLTPPQLNSEQLHSYGMTERQR